MPTPLLTPVCVFNFGISPVRDSKHSIRNSDFFALIHTHNSHLRRTTYPSILRDKPESKPRPGSTGGDLSRKSQNVNPRDADPTRFTGAKKSFSPTPNFFSCYLFYMLLSFLFCYLLCDPPGASENSRNPSHFTTAEPKWCGRWDLNPRTPTGQAPQACASKTPSAITGSL